MASQKTTYPFFLCGRHKTFFLCLVGFLFSFSSLQAQATYIDNFNTVSYANNNGTSNFSGNWVETNESTSPTSGRIRINSNQLRFRNLDNRYITRNLDLSGASSATLTLSYNRTSGNESILVQLWNGSSYTTVATLAGSGNVNYALAANQMSSSSSIRLITGSGNWGSSETIFVDNIQFTATFAPAVTVEDVSVDEDAGTMTFTATHVNLPAAGPFTVDYTTVDGSAAAPGDYTSSSGTLSFDGSVNDTEQIVITINDDFTFEGDETFTISFTGTSDTSVDIADTATGTIQDNDSDPNAPRPYEERYTMNLEGNFIMRGNTNLQCAAGCPGTPVTNNPPITMGYIDVDTDGTTINSSNNTFTIPGGATVVWAGLYWGGMYNSSFGGITNPPGSVNIDQVKFMEPGAATYTMINAQVRNIETASAPGWRSFMSYADVTSTVQAAGSGVYHVADIALATGSSYTGPYGGWNMVIVYDDPAQTTKNISIWDGFQFFGFGANDNFTVTGLLTPASGAFQTHAGYFGFDGEANRTGDFVSIDGTSLTNALNPANNALNGTISEFGVDVGGRNPNFGYSWGIDSDVYDASGTVSNSATSANIVLGSSFEGIWGGVFVISNEIAFPAVASKNFDSATVYVGDESTVTITVNNPAQGVPLTNFSITDNFPAGMTIAPTPNASSSCGGTITAPSGATSFVASGITLAAGSSCTFTFDVVAATDGTFVNTVLPTDIGNDQNIPLQGQASGTLTVLPLPDNDGDGVADRFDLDDDNDGITDADELNTIVSNSQQDCTGETTLDFSAAATLESGTALQQGAVYRISNITAGTDALVTIEQTVNATVANIDDNTSDAAAFRPQTAFSLTNIGDRGYIEYRIQFVTASGSTPVNINKFFLNFNDIDGNTNYAEQAWADNPTSYVISNPTDLTMITEGSWVIGTAGTTEYPGAGNTNPQVNFGINYNSKTEVLIRVGAEARVPGASAGGRQHNIEFACLTNYNNPENYSIDMDSDGVANHLDLDADNDGIYDAVEAGHGQAHSAGIISGPYGANGLGDSVETVAESGVINYTVVDTDGTEAANFLDTDSDGDSCSDANEAYADANADGGDNEFYGTGSPPGTDANGRVTTATYPVPADNGSNGTQDYVEVINMSISTQPVDTTTCPGCNTNFTVSTANVNTYQWQLFDGSSWNDLTDTGIYSGTTTNTLTITNATTAENGNQYRVVMSNTNDICDSLTSNSATLTIAVNTIITNRRITYRVNRN